MSTQVIKGFTVIYTLGSEVDQSTQIPSNIVISTDKISIDEQGEVVRGSKVVSSTVSISTSALCNSPGYLKLTSQKPEDFDDCRYHFTPAGSHNSVTLRHTQIAAHRSLGFVLHQKGDHFEIEPRFLKTEKDEDKFMNPTLQEGSWCSIQ